MKERINVGDICIVCNSPRYNRPFKMSDIVLVLEADDYYQYCRILVNGISNLWIRITDVEKVDNE